MDQVVVRIREEEDVARSRRAARAMASDIGMDKYQCAELELSTSELARNLIIHAGGGTITLERIETGKIRGVKLVCEDRGPGIPDIGLAMTEGYSTGQTMGSGLPGVKRMMDEFDISSEPGCGTRVVAVKWLKQKSL